VDNHRGKNCCLPGSNLRDPEQGHLDSATASKLAPAVLRKEDWSCNLNICGFRISQLYSKDRSVFFCARVRVLALIISSRELIKSLQRRQQLGEKGLVSFLLLS